LSRGILLGSDSSGACGTGECPGDFGVAESVDFLLDLEVKFALKKARGRRSRALEDLRCAEGDVFVGESGLGSRAPSVSLIIPSDMRLLSHLSAMISQP